MKLCITTQYRENYGAHDWDGTGQCDQYWKNKGGEEYFVSLEGVPDSDFLMIHVERIVDSLRPKLEFSDMYSEQHIIGFDVVADDYMTEYERSQLKYDGEIKYPARVLELA